MKIISEDSPGAVPTTVGSARVIGCHRGATAGPTIVVVGGIHGNEPSGVHAARRVIERLAREPPPLRGELIALAGNRRALGRNCRYIGQHS